jgi:hypothetical protein
MLIFERKHSNEEPDVRVLQTNALYITNSGVPNAIATVTERWVHLPRNAYHYRNGHAMLERRREDSFPQDPSAGRVIPVGEIERE